jgi:hypothetical protein
MGAAYASATKAVKGEIDRIKKEASDISDAARESLDNEINRAVSEALDDRMRRAIGNALQNVVRDWDASH